MASNLRFLIFSLALNLATVLVNSQYSFEKPMEKDIDIVLKEDVKVNKVDHGGDETKGSFAARIGARDGDGGQFSGYGQEQVSGYSNDENKNDVVAIAAASVAFGIGALGLAWYIQDLYSRLDENDDLITQYTSSIAQLEDDLDSYQTKEGEICSTLSDLTKISYTNTVAADRNNDQFNYLQDIDKLSINC